MEEYHPLTSRESAVMAAVTHDSTPPLNPTLVLSSARPQQLFASMCEGEGMCVRGSYALAHDVKEKVRE